MKPDSNDFQKTSNTCVNSNGIPFRKISVAILVFIGLIFYVALPLTYSGNSDPLTPEERVWLNQHDGKIIVNNEAGWPPIIDIDKDGNSFGIVMDYQKLLEKKLSFKFKLDKLDSWDNFMERFKKGKIDVNNNLQKTPERTEYALFTKPYIEIPNAIIVRKEIKGSMTLKKMSGMKIAVAKDFAIHNYIRKNFDFLQLLPFQTDLECLLETSTKNVDAAVVNLAVASFIIEKSGITNLRVAGYADYSNALCFASKKDWPILNQILEKGLNLITHTERDIIFKKWISLGYEPFYKNRHFWIVSCSVAVAIFIFIVLILGWNRSLKRLVQLRTKKLEAANIQLKDEIEERKRAEEELSKNEQKFKSMIDSSPLAIYMSSGIDQKAEYINPTFSKLFGYTLKDVPSASHWWPLAYPDETYRNKIVEEWQLKVENAIRTNSEIEPMETVVTCKDGSKKEIFWGYISTGVQNWAFGLDLTERIHAEKALKESQSYLQSVFEAVPVGICFMKDRVYQRVNRNWCERFGYPEESLLGRSTEFLYKNKKEYERVGKELTEQILEQGIALVHTRLKRGDGEFRDVDLIAKPLNSQNIADGTVVAVHDITEHKQTEKEKLTAQKIAGKNEKLALVGQIAGKMAHDFNNILGIVMGNTELALLDCQEPKTKKTLELIYQQTIRGKNLTKNLVAFAKDQELKQEFFRISEKIDLVINLMRKDLEGIELIKEERPGIPELLADPGMIEHALVNLIQNSIHALSVVEHPRITVRTYSRDNHICFEIEDNGCGISKEHLENIYEPSFTLKGNKDVTGSYKTGIKGTGYGMSNVKKYIEQHKGTISVESEFGSGTKFIISLPIIKKELTKEEKTEIRTGNAYFEKYILLVEDEQAIADVQYRILTQDPCNHKVDIANNGQVAMDLFGRNKYDLISLDYILPGGINGMDIYNHIRTSDKTIPILFISGNIVFLESIRDLMNKDPYVDHLSKPCKNIHYLNCINKLFSRDA